MRQVVRQLISKRKMSMCVAAIVFVLVFLIWHVFHVLELPLVRIEDCVRVLVSHLESKVS
jgi:hypothetical protein